MQPQDGKANGKAGSWRALPKGFRIISTPGYRRNTPVSKRRLTLVEDRWVTRPELAEAKAYIEAVNGALEAKAEALRKRIEALKFQLDGVEGSKFDEGLPWMTYEVDGDHAHDQEFWAVRYCSGTEDEQHGVERMTADGRFTERSDMETGRPIFEAKATH